MSSSSSAASIMADTDGVLVILRKIGEAVLMRAEQIEKNELEIHDLGENF
jgi:regulator of RNase E activity RraA